MLYGEALTSTSSPEEHPSPYPDHTSPSVHTCLENAFAREYCARRQMSKDAPLKVVGNIGGGIALPRIEKGRKIMKDRKGDWSSTEEIPVRFSALFELLILIPTTPFGPYRDAISV